MSSWPTSSCWGVAIDTDAYSGNFEREMCAYITGFVGECGVGEEFLEYFPFEGDRVLWVADVHGCARPCTIFQDPKQENKYQSVLIYFEKKPTKKEIKIIKSRAAGFLIKFQDVLSKQGRKCDLKKIYGFRLVQFIFYTKITNL